MASPISSGQPAYSETLTERQYLLRARKVCAQLIDNPSLTSEQKQQIVQKVREELSKGQSLFQSKKDLENLDKGLQGLNV